MNVLQQINKQAELLKNLGFEVHVTQVFKDMVETGFIHSCDTHIIQYPPHLHLSNYLCLWKNGKQYNYAVRICTGGLPEEIIKSLELLGYTLNDDVLIYESIKHNDAGNTE